MKSRTNSYNNRSKRGFTLVELLVVITIIAVLSAIAFPMGSSAILAAKQAATISQLRQLTTMAVSYAFDQNGRLPDEGGEGVQTFANLGKAENATAWYNQLPEMAGQKPAKDFRSNPKDFYTDNSILFLKGAKYPKNKNAAAYFAYGINSQLDGARLTAIPMPSRTALFAEARLPDEKTLPPFGSGSVGTDLGQPKVRDKRFVARYRNVGVIAFADGHAEAVPVSKAYDTNVVVWEIPVAQAQN